MTFTLSVEPIASPVYQHPYHLGTIEAVARTIAEDYFIANHRHTRTVALMRGGHIFDVYDGRWSSDVDAEGDYI